MPLTVSEIEEFYADLQQHSQKSTIRVSDVEHRLCAVYHELTPDAKPHHLHSDERKAEFPVLLGRLFPGYEGNDELSKEAFIECVKAWHIPTQTKVDKLDNFDYEQDIPLSRRWKAFIAVEGPQTLFIIFVTLLIIAMSLWQGLIYVTNPQARRALGWGVIMAKFSAGALYPTLFFCLLSMSRYLHNFTRRFYRVSLFLNVDFSQAFHIIISSLAFFFATLHVIGHLSGTFVFGSSADRQEAVRVLKGEQYVRRSYAEYVRTLPGWTGLTAYTCFFIIVIFALPWIRRRNWEIFQLSHLLMFPMLGFLCVHGTAYFLQAPMLGYWLVFPALLVITERALRILRGFRPLNAILEKLDNNTVCVTIDAPGGRPWDYAAGQYIFLQVPTISYFQWHPFTVSGLIENKLQVHIKLEGSWTTKLSELHDKLSKDEGQQVKIRCGLDGPFGSPAQRFYQFDRAIIVGSGVGVTPFSAIVSDLEINNRAGGDPFKLLHRDRRLFSRTQSRRSNPSLDTMVDQEFRKEVERTKDNEKHSSPNKPAPRRVDFHWNVRDKEQLLWFADLLNRASDMQDHDFLDLHLNTYITAKRTNISQKIFRFVLDDYRTDQHPYSALTGLKVKSRFGRPDFERILAEYHQDMVREQYRGKVGIFFCGPPAIARELADRSVQLTRKSQANDTGIKYYFMNEVFN